jgi:hypothetical protein
MFIIDYMIKLDMPVNCRQIVVSFNKSFRIFPSTNDVQRYCRYHKLEIVSAESQMGSYIITVKKADSTI